MDGADNIIPSLNGGSIVCDKIAFHANNSSFESMDD